MAKDSLRIRVGEQVFYTSRATIASGGRNTFLAAITDPLWQRPGSSEETETVQEVFIDRNPAYFSVILDFLRSGELHIPGSMSQTAFFREAQYYGVLEQVRAASRQPLNRDHMARTAIVGVCPVLRRTSTRAIQANADGGCCVTQEGVVRVYNWMLEQQATLSLDHAPVNCTAFMEGAGDLNRLLIGTDKITFTCTCPEKLEGADVAGGLACFDTCSGDVVHRYSVEAGDKVWENFKAAAVAANGEPQVFAYCTLDQWQWQGWQGRWGTLEWMDGIGTWDGATGQQISFLPHEGSNTSTSRSWGHKLQWLPRSSSLLVAYSSTNRSWAGLLDPRANALPSLLDSREYRPAGGARSDTRLTPSGLFQDVVVMEDCVSVWVADSWRGLGFYDMRHGGGMKAVTWDSDRNHSYDFSSARASGTEAKQCRSVECSRCSCPRASPGEWRQRPQCHTRLACWGCRLFATADNKVCVFSSPTWTGPSGSGGGGAPKNRPRPGLLFSTAVVSMEGCYEGVADISVGGDRLFVLRKDKDVFQVWETPNILTRNYLHGL